MECCIQSIHRIVVSRPKKVQLLHLKFREHCRREGRKITRVRDTGFYQITRTRNTEFAVKFCLLGISEAISIHDFLHMDEDSNSRQANVNLESPGGLNCTCCFKNKNLNFSNEDSGARCCGESLLAQR